MTGDQKVPVTKEVVLSLSGYSSDMPSNPVEFAKLINDAVEKIPTEFRGTAEVDWDTDYDSSDLSFSISYKRPKTQEEIDAEIARQKAYQERRATDDLHSLANSMRRLGITSAEVDNQQLKYTLAGAEKKSG